MGDAALVGHFRGRENRMPLQARRSALVAVRLARWATFQTTLPALKKGRRQALRRNAPALRL